MNTKPSDTQFVRDYQSAWDWLSVSANASFQAENRFRHLYAQIAKRGIEAADKEDAVPDGLNSLRQIYFHPTEEEREELRNLYLDWQAYKIIHQEKTAAHDHLKRTGSSLKAIDTLNNKIAMDTFHRFVAYLEQLGSDSIKSMVTRAIKIKAD